MLIANLGEGQDALSQNISTVVDNPVYKSELDEEVSSEVRPTFAHFDKAIAQLQAHMTPQNFDLWFRPITCKHMDETRLTLVAPNRFLRDWFEDHYLPAVLQELQRLTDRLYEATWVIEETSVQLFPEQAERKLVMPPSLAIAAEAQSVAHPPDLLARYTFDSFVVGPSNQLAEAASRAVAALPGGKYNPLFLYGGVGLGKTHLLHAIGHHIYQQHPSWRILYVKAETFMNEYIQAVRNNRIEEFRGKYRQKVDVLLMDDIQYLGGKERTQDEFFHTFNVLFESGKQIVVTADRYPHQIQDLEDRIRSRFQWGLVADIHAPELETRMAILLKKAEAERIQLPTEVAYFLAANIKSNVRELEGLLIRVAALASVRNQAITVDFAQETLQNVMATSAAAVTAESVQKRIAAFFRVTVEELKSNNRHKAVAHARQVAMFLVRKLCKTSYPDIGKAFGNKDHTTVLAACRKVESKQKDDASFRQEISDLERQLR